MMYKIVGAAVAAAVFGACLPAFAAEATSDGFPPAQNLDYYHVPGPDMAADGTMAPAGGGSQYLFLAGSAFTPRTSSQTVSYLGGGCSFSNGAITTSLELPDGTSILGVRLFYYNSGSPGGVGLFFTQYDGAGGLNDLLTGTSTTNTGYASEFFPTTSTTLIDNASQAYVLTATMSANLRLCGMRVFYSP